MKNKELTHRLNRAIGQIESIKRSLLVDGNDDCIKTLQQLKASINALKKFGEAYMSEHLEDCIKEGVSSEEMKKNMKKVISGTFFL